MSSTGSNGPAKSISSIREDTGSNINDVLELGRMLAAQLADHNTVGRWMAHHLAELVVAAQDDATVTVEQRQQIVETILKIWAHRRYYPGRAPLEEFTRVFVALDRLGDGSPWKFSRAFNVDADMPDPSTSGLPLVATAAELERLTRETLLRLIWLAAQDATEKNQEWIETADKVALNLESEVTETLRRLLRRRGASRRLRTKEGDPSDVAEIANDTSIEDVSGRGEDEDASEYLTEGTTENGTVNIDGEDTCRDPSDDEHDDESDSLSYTNHVKRLREMADLLNKIADALTVPNSPA